MENEDTSEIASMLSAFQALLEASRRLAVLGERLLAVAADRTMTESELSDAHREISNAQASLDKLETMVALRRQGFRPF